MADYIRTSHELFKLNGFLNQEINNEFNKYVIQYDNFYYRVFEANNKNNIILYLNQLTESNEYKKIKNLSIYNDIEWDSDYKIKLSSSLFVSLNSYQSLDNMIDWTNKYLLGYCFLLLSSSTTWDDYTARLYFDYFDIERLKRLRILSDIENWKSNKIDLYNSFLINKYINKTNIIKIMAKYKLIRKIIINLLEQNKINNDYELLVVLINLCSKLKNDFTYNNNAIVELFTYDFSQFEDQNIVELYCQQVKHDDIRGIIPYKVLHSFHRNKGYLGQFLRIITARDKLIPEKTLIILRDGHATSPSIYEKYMLNKFINSGKKILLGINPYYNSYWHRHSIDGYHKGILMGYINIVDNLDDDLYNESWGKMFSIRKESDNYELDAINERTNNAILSKINKYSNKEINPYDYGMDEFLGCQLGADISGNTVNNGGHFDFDTTKIYWQNMLWFDGLSVNMLHSDYIFVYNALIYLIIKIFKTWNRFFIINNPTLHEFVYFLICMREYIKKNNIQINKTFMMALNTFIDINNNIYYSCINSGNDVVINQYINKLFGDELFYYDDNNKLQIYDGLEKLIDGYDGYDIVGDKPIVFHVIEKYKYVNQMVNDRIENRDIYFGEGWQENLFSKTDYFDYKKDVPIKLKINDRIKILLKPEKIIQYGGGKIFTNIDLAKNNELEVILLCQILNKINKEKYEEIIEIERIIISIVVNNNLSFINDNINIQNVYDKLYKSYLIDIKKAGRDAHVEVKKYIEEKLKQMFVLIVNTIKYRYDYNLRDNILTIYSMMQRSFTYIEDKTIQQLSRIIIFVNLMINYICIISKFKKNDDVAFNNIIDIIYKSIDTYNLIKINYTREELDAIDEKFKLKEINTQVPINLNQNLDVELLDYNVFIDIIPEVDREILYDENLDSSKKYYNLAVSIVKRLLEIQNKQPQQVGGNYKEKYLKYKNKYLELKNQLKL